MSVNVGTAVGYLDLDTSKFKSALSDAQKQLSSFSDNSLSAGDKFKNFGNGLKSIGSTLSTAVTVPIVGIGTAAVATAANFEKSMDNVAALSGATGKDLEDLTNLAKQMGETTQFSASEAADALGYMALAGWKTDESMKGLPGVLDLAAASGMGLAEASDMVTDYLSAFGEEADQAGRMADVLAKAQASSNTTAQGLGEAFKNCAVNANAFGLDIEQTTAVLGKLADQGLKGSEAGTALNAVFRDMSSKMKDGAIEIGKTSVKITDANGNFRSMADIVKDVSKATDGLSESEKMVALQSTFTADSIKAMGILMNTGGDSIEEFTNSLYGAKGAASDMASAMNDNLSGQITLLKSALEGAAISIGEALLPMIKGLVSGINELVNWFNSLNPGIQQTIIIIAGIAAAIGPVLMIIGQLAISIGALMPVFTAIGTFITGTLVPALTATGVAFGAVTIPVWGLIAVFAALVAAGVLVYKNWDEIKAKCIEIWEGSIKPTIEAVTNTLKAFLTAAWEGIKAFLETCWNLLKQLASSIWEGIKNTITTVSDAIKTTITTVWNAIKTAITTVWNAIKTTTTTVWNGIKSLITTVINSIKSVITTVFNSIKSVVTTAWNGVKTATSTAWNGIKTAVSTGVNAVKSTISRVFSTLSSVLTAPFRTAQSVISGILGGISRTISSITSAAKKVTSLFRTVEPPTQEQEPVVYNDIDYSKAKFNYAKAKQTTISDVIAKNNSMVESFKDFGKNIKLDNREAKVNNESVININLTIDKMLNSDNRSINDIANELAANLKRRNLALGGVR